MFVKSLCRAAIILSELLLTLYLLLPRIFKPVFTFWKFQKCCYLLVFIFLYFPHTSCVYLPVISVCFSLTSDTSIHLTHL